MRLLCLACVQTEHSPPPPRSQTNLTSRLPVTRGHAGTRIRKHVHVSASQQTAFRLTCGSSQSAECNLAGLLFALSTSEGAGLIWCDIADTTLRARRRPCRWLIQAQTSRWGSRSLRFTPADVSPAFSMTLRPCNKAESSAVNDAEVEMGSVQSETPEKWLSTTTVCLHAARCTCRRSEHRPADLSQTDCPNHPARLNSIAQSELH